MLILRLSAEPTEIRSSLDPWVATGWGGHFTFNFLLKCLRAFGEAGEIGARFEKKRAHERVTHVETEDGAGGVLLCRQLLQVLVEQLKKGQVKQTDPGLLVLKHLHVWKGFMNTVHNNKTCLIRIICMRALRAHRLLLAWSPCKR